MFLRSKVQEMILKRRSRSMNSNGASAQRSHVVPDQLAASPSSKLLPCDSGNSGSGSGGSKSALFAPPRLLHSSSLPTGSVSGKNNSPAPDAESTETTTAFSMSPTSVLDAAAASFASGPDAVLAGNSKRRPWREGGAHGLADALDCTDDEEEQQQQQGRRRSGVLLAATSPSLLARSCSLDRRVEFGVKNKSSWLPAAAADPPGTEATEMEPSSEDYTCVICRGPNPRTLHIFGDRVVESSPRPISSNLMTTPPPPRGEGAFSSL